MGCGSSNLLQPVGERTTGAVPLEEEPKRGSALMESPHPAADKQPDTDVSTTQRNENGSPDNLQANGGRTTTSQKESLYGPIITPAEIADAGTTGSDITVSLVSPKSNIQEQLGNTLSDSGSQHCGLMFKDLQAKLTPLSMIIMETGFHFPKPEDVNSCLRACTRSKWPIRCLASLPKYNVNAGPGGCAALVLISNSYNTGDNTTAEIFFVRSGVDSNHTDNMCLMKSNGGHFGGATSLRTDEDGCLLLECLFGDNHIALLSNNLEHGNLQNGVFLQGGFDGEQAFDLELNINAGVGGETTLLMCCGIETGIPDFSLATAVYMIRSGKDGNFFSTSLVYGDNKWKFEVQGPGNLFVSGVDQSRYALYRNRETGQQPSTAQRSKALHLFTEKGDEKLVLLKSVMYHSLLLVLCSTSYGIENATSAALYAVSVFPFGSLTAKLVSGRDGFANHDSAAKWTFGMQDGDVVIHGPPQVCRYAVMATLKECARVPSKSFSPKPYIGYVFKITKEIIQAGLSRRCTVKIQINGSVVETVKSYQLKKNGSDFGFEISIKDKTRAPGLYLIRVIALVKHLKHSGSSRLEVELQGSPQQVVIQPPGVLYALNCCGPSYQAYSDIVYTSEHRQFANFSYDFNFGSTCKAFGIEKTKTRIPQLLTGGHDGHLYCKYRTSAAEAKDEQKIHYIVENIPNGNHTLRFHSIGGIGSALVCGKDIASKLRSLFENQKEILEGYHMHQVDVPVTITNRTFELKMGYQEICALALLDSSYKEKTKSKEEIEENERVRQNLCNSVEPLNRDMLRKEAQIVGWSQNLLQNASGETGSLSYWNVTGDWKVNEGGYETEKSFASSFMDCIKYQEVNLCDHFSPDYLDTQPPIQVCEWYREGCCGGGYYMFTATLMDANGMEIKKYSTGKLGNLYRNNKWEQASITFSEYGGGARRVGIESFGKDDKYWGGHYGPIVSGSVIRVQREVKAAKEDQFADIQMGVGNNSTGEREKLVNKLLTDNKDLLAELSKDVKDTIDAKSSGTTSSRTGRKSKPRKPREVRVFVSSTFRDMQVERERLIKKTFRELNNLCSERGVFFTYVDLRWGITSEQSSYGQTIAICLQEIERCRPYFVCMLGERFGWCQREEDPDKLLNESYNYAVENFPSLAWVDKYRFNTSVTQLEVMHAVLNQPSQERSFFYLRSPVTAESMGISSEELKLYQSESEWHHEKVYNLRNTIERSNLHIRHYNLPYYVCDLIKQDLMKCIDEDFPVGSEPTPLEREREAHKAFADARCRVYIGRQEYFQRIEEYFSAHKLQPLVVLGESGSGKSALIANWTVRTADESPDTFVFLHFIGSSAESAAYLKLLRRLYEELKDFFGLDMAIPSSDTALIRDLSKWLTLAGSKARCVIVLDALNQLDDGTGEDGSEHDLLWLPSTLPPNVYMLLSTLPGRAFDAVLAAGWPTFKVNPLDVAEKDEIITGYLTEIYGKNLNSEQKEMIIEAPQTNNPLYLRVLLDEVRMYGAFFTLTDKIKDYLSASSPADLFAKILNRLEVDMERGQESRPNLVKDTTTAIWCSNRGMSESELIDLLQIKSATWSPFYLSLVESLVNRNGILNFFHDHLRQAVENRYLVTVETKKEGYLRLANFFSEKPMDKRTIVELPFLLAKAGELDRLRELITDLEVFKKMIASEDGKFDLIKSWKMLGEFTEAEKAYLAEVAKMERSTKHEKKAYQDLLTNLAEFFMDLGLLDASRNVFRDLLEEMELFYKGRHSRIIYSPFDYSWRRCCVHPDVLDVLQKLGTVCQKQKDLNQAEVYYKEAISRQNRITSPADELMLCDGLHGLAVVFYLKKDMKESKKVLVRARELATNVLGPKHHYVAAIINKLGQLSYKQGRVDEALGFFIQDLKLTRGDVGTAHPRTAGILNDIGLVYDDQNNPLAGQLFEAALTILLDVYGTNHLDVAAVRYNLGYFYFATNYYAKAKYQFTQAHKTFSAFLGSDHADTEAALAAMEALRYRL